MKKLYTFLFLGLAAVVFAQVSAQKQQTAADKARSGGPGTEIPVISTIARGLVDITDTLLVWATSSGLVFEGATDDAYETTLALTDPTADQTVTLPNATGTVLVSATETVTAANVITASENGSVFYLNSATEFASTLPAPAAGLRFTFIVKAAPSGASYTITTTSSANIVLGHVLTSDLDGAADADSETSGGDTVSLVDGVAVVGDMVEVWSDGTSWYVRGSCKVYNAITITTAS